MFIISLNYHKELSELDKYIDEHIVFLNRYYAKEKFIFSGRKNPRTGGVILAHNCTKEEVKNLIKEDPFYINDLATYEITEVLPSMCDRNFKIFMED